jgi:Flp pilus assembly protein TadD
VLVRKEQYAEAIEHFRAALRLRPDSPETRHNLDVAVRLSRDRER